MTSNASSTVNVDSAEIANFDRLAASWWDANGAMRALHVINVPRVQYVARCVVGLRNKAIIDVGCGGGILSEALAREGVEVTGIDLAADALQVARDHAQSQGVTVDYQQITAEAIAEQRPNYYDAAVCMEMLEHVPDPASIVAACARLVRPGGDVIFSTIHRNPKSFALMILGAEYLTNLVPRGTHQYEKFIRPSELESWARAAGLQVIGIQGLRYNPLLKSARLANDTDVNYFLHCRKPEPA